MKTIYKSLLFLVIFLNTNLSIAQNDYVVEYSTKDTCISTSIIDYDNMLRHIIPDKKAITHVYKIDLIQLARQKLNFSFEHSIKPKLSLEHEAIFRIVMQSNYTNATNIYDYLNRRDPIFIDKFSKNSLYYLSLGSSLKYYYNMDSRIKRGKNTNGFSGNYITAGFKINMAFYNTDLWHVQYDGQVNEYSFRYSPEPKIERYFPFNDQDNRESMGYINFGYGIQRRIGNVGFWSAEAKAGIGTGKYFDTLYIPIELKLKAGFALSSFKTQPIKLLQMKTIKQQFFIVLSLFMITSFNYKELKAQEHVFTKNIVKTINLQNKALIIDAEKANINIEEIAGENLIVDIRFISKNNNKNLAEKQLEYINHVINIKNREVYIRTYILIAANEELTGSIHTLYTLKIPKNKSITITNSLGDISIKNIEGRFVINSKYGKLNLQNITGEATINAQIGEVIIKNSQLNCKLDSKYLSSYFYSCGGYYSIVANLGSINFTLNQNLSNLTIDASGTEITLLNRDCKEYNLSLVAESGSIILDDCSNANKSCIKLDSRNSTKQKQEFIYTNPTIKQSILVKNKFSNISLQ